VLAILAYLYHDAVQLPADGDSNAKPQSRLQPQPQEERQPQPQPQEERQPQPSPQAPEEQLVSLITRLGELPVSFSKTFYRKGDPIELNLDLPMGGFLHVFIVEPGGKATLIFPNKLVPNNQVKPGNLKLPNGKPPLVATPPYGKLWFVAVLQVQSRNIYQQGSEGAGKKPVFIEWTAQQLLAFLQEAQGDSEAQTGGAETRICATTGPCQ
jgi:hypothetical protein